MIELKWFEVLVRTLVNYKDQTRESKHALSISCKVAIKYHYHFAPP